MIITQDMLDSWASPRIFMDTGDAHQERPERLVVAFGRHLEETCSYDSVMERVGDMFVWSWTREKIGLDALLSMRPVHYGDAMSTEQFLYNSEAPNLLVFQQPMPCRANKLTAFGADTRGILKVGLAIDEARRVWLETYGNLLIEYLSRQGMSCINPVDGTKMEPMLMNVVVFGDGDDIGALVEKMAESAMRFMRSHDASKDGPFSFRLADWITRSVTFLNMLCDPSAKIERLIEVDAWSLAAAYADKDHPERSWQIKELLDLDHSEDGVRKVLDMAKDLAQRYFLLQNPEA